MSDINSLDFSATSIQELHIDSLTWDGFHALANGLESTVVDYLFVAHAEICPYTLMSLDFSQTDLVDLHMIHCNLSDEHLMNLHLQNSQITTLELGGYGNEFTSVGLSALSQGLEGSSVETLDFWLGGWGKGFDASMLSSLTFENTAVKKLSFTGSKITDDDLKGLNFKQLGDVREIDLSYNDLTSEGINYLRNAIDGTSVLKVTLATSHNGSWYGVEALSHDAELVNSDFIIFNQNPTLSVKNGINNKDVLLQEDSIFSEQGDFNQAFHVSNSETAPIYQPTQLTSIENFIINEIL